MAEHLKESITELQEQLRSQEQEVADTKRLINMLAKRAGMPQIYSDTDAESIQSLGAITPDRFYGRPLATVIREYLMMRKAGGLGSASVNEIYDALVRGGYKFEAKDDENAKRGLRISLMKHKTMFHKLPNGTFGLLEWYPSVRTE